MLFWLQDRLGWRVVRWSGCDRRRCRTCPRVPLERAPRWWNIYGRRLVRDHPRHATRVR